MNGLVRAATAAALGLGIAACGSTSAAAPSSSGTPSPSGAAQRRGTSGELVQIKGTTLVLNTQSGDATVTFSSNTTIQKTSTGTVADIVAGSCIVATGQKDAAGILSASTVRLSPPVGGACTQPGVPGARGTPRPGATPRAGTANLAAARGQVTAVSGTSVTVTDPTGKPATITVPTTVRVAKSAPATASDLTVGSCITAAGPKDSAGKVTASTLAIVPAGPSGCFTGGRGGFPGGGGGFPGGGGAGAGGGGAAGN